MAEAANFALNQQSFPSIFEISAAEFLDNLLYPAFSKIFRYLGLKLDFVFNGVHISEDISALVIGGLQYLYLSKRGGSFGESFYGLQRSSIATSEVLSHKKQVISAFLLTVVPYLQMRIRQRIEQHEATKWEDCVSKAFHVYKVIKVVHNLLYLSKYSISHSPIFRALGICLQYPRIPSADDKTTIMIVRLLEVMAFFLQFIDWWYSSSQRQKIGSLKNPGPIKKSTLLQRQHPSGICPVCLQKITNPTACAISGYVFCWKCIANHIKERSKCPVTGYPISVEDLVRIYEN